jgi:outer membrane protein OmpA-like peptidoglycan-associated protein
VKRGDVVKQTDIKTYAILGLVGGVSLLALACGAALAPRELLDAREAYSRAKAGPASSLALAELETAKQALQEAESAFRDGEEDDTKNLAYVAERRAQLANAAGDLEKANRDRAQALKSRQDAQDKYQRATEEKLTAAQRALEEKSRQSQMTAAELEEEKAKRLAAEKKAAAALQSLEQLAKVKEEARGVVITLSGSVLFATGKYELLPIAMSKLDEVAKALVDQGYKSIVVEGHTDSMGGDGPNTELSQRRADSVRMHLVSRGITASKISSVGLGESRPIADNSSPEGRANNRRVEIVVQPER